jgi:hypothetical protein
MSIFDIILTYYSTKGKLNLELFIIMRYFAE